MENNLEEEERITFRGYERNNNKYLWLKYSNIITDTIIYLGIFEVDNWADGDLYTYNNEDGENGDLSLLPKYIHDLDENGGLDLNGCLKYFSLSNNEEEPILCEVIPDFPDIKHVYGNIMVTTNNELVAIENQNVNDNIHYTNILPGLTVNKVWYERPGNNNSTAIVEASNGILYDVSSTYVYGGNLTTTITEINNLIGIKAVDIEDNLFLYNSNDLYKGDILLGINVNKFNKDSFITTDGEVYTIDGDEVNLVDGINDVTDFKKGMSHYNNYYALKNGKVYSIGNNSYGQLGTGNKVNSTEFKEVIFPESITIKDIFPIQYGDPFVFALDTNGTLWGWGNYYYIGADYNVYGRDVTSPIEVMNNIKEIQIPSGNFVAIKNDNTIWTMRNGKSYEHNNYYNSSGIAFEILGGANKILNIQSYYPLILTNDNKLLYVYSYNDKGIQYLGEDIEEFLTIDAFNLELNDKPRIIKQAGMYYINKYGDYETLIGVVDNEKILGHGIISTNNFYYEIYVKNQNSCVIKTEHSGLSG